MTDQDPLSSLIVDESHLAREELADTLRPYLRLGRSGQVVIDRAFDQLTALQKVACILLGLAAAHMLDLRDRRGATPQEIVRVSGLAGGTVRPKLSELLRDRYAVRDGHDYAIPIHAIRRITDLLRSREQ